MLANKWHVYEAIKKFYDDFGHEPTFKEIKKIIYGKGLTICTDGITEGYAEWRLTNDK